MLCQSSCDLLEPQCRKSSLAPLLHLELDLPIRHELRIPHHIFQPTLISHALLQFLAIKQVLHCRWPVEILYNVIIESFMGLT